ncbi:MAG: DUF1294 domain-containing protein [Clostridiales bacterium]|jgi:uncharacterized membrane protein YsdA (DUF1294 family)|nr:DUF1294 domain-containing protein [Clostridiales bacterium]
MAIYYFALNMVLFILFYIDKRSSQKNSWRVRESTLLFMGLAGGAIGGLAGMNFFHHKTRKKYFFFVYTFSVVAHVACLVFLLR